MKSIKLFFLFLGIILSTSTYSQKNDIDFLVNSIKTGYIGYRYKVANENKFDQYIKQAMIDGGADTFRTLSLIANYFRDPHLKVYGNKNVMEDSISTSKKLRRITEHLLNINFREDSYEGYWINDINNCVVALIKVSNHPTRYDAYVVESRDNKLMAGTICAQFESLKGNKYSVYYLSPISGKRSYWNAVFKNKSRLIIGPATSWSKLTKYDKNLLTSLPKYVTTATAKLLDKDNYLITIPSNSEENTKIIDSIVKADYQIISTTKNLIIDIRGNIGGTIRAYSPLLPLVCTKPIVRIGGYTMYSTLMLEAATKDLNESRKQKIDSIRLAKKEANVAKIKANLNKTLLNLGDTFICETCTTYPRNVAIIANYACLSAAEMMIMDFKQSSKVTLFGEKTYGGVDYLDNFTTNFPSSKYILGMPTLRRFLFKGQKKLDEVGISPDVPILDSVTNWVQFVQHYYQKTGRDK